MAINGRFLGRKTTGVDRFAIEILRHWLPLYGANSSARILVPRNLAQLAKIPQASRVNSVGNLQGHAWEQIDLPRFCRQELLLSLCNSGPVSKRAQLLVIHDAAVVALPKAYGLAYRSWYRVVYAMLLRRLNVIATVSRFSASELMKCFGLPANRIELIRESGEHILSVCADVSILSRLGIREKAYILVVGSRSANKNFRAVVEAVALIRDLQVSVVAVGGGNARVFSNVDLIDEGIILAGFVSDAELRALYENALCFVFPSFYEGFGLPPLEAMHCGCPTLVSRRASMPEICGEASIYCEPDDPSDIAKKLRLILNSQSLRNELRQSGLARVTQFSWAGAAQDLQNVASERFGDVG